MGRKFLVRNFFSILVAGLILLCYQNCTQVDFEPAKDQSSSNTAQRSGNGNEYEGKLGYYRLIPNHRCENQFAYYGLINIEEDSATQSINTPEKCGSLVNSPINRDEIDSAKYNPKFISYKEGIYEQYRFPPYVSPSKYEYLEALCRKKSADGGGLDVVVRFDHRDERTTVSFAEGHFDGQTVVGNTTTPFLARRKLSPLQLLYTAAGFKLAITLDSYVSGQLGIYSGQLLATVDGQQKDTKISCRLGGHLDLMASRILYNLDDYFYVSQPIVPVLPQSDLVFTQFSVSPALPNGMILNPSTGAISGTPNELREKRFYSVTATNGTDATTTWIEIGVGNLFTVNSMVDAVDLNPGDGLCASANGQCTVRAALQEAGLQNPYHSKVQLAAGTYFLTGGHLLVSSDLHIVGQSRNTTILDGQLNSRVLYINRELDVKVENLTIRNGSVDYPENGGGIYVDQNVNLHVKSCQISNNSTVRSTGGLSSNPSSSGGGIFSALGYGKTIIEDSIISNNNAFYNGGGLWADGPVEIIASQFINNIANFSEGGGIRAGYGIRILDSLFEGNTLISGNFGGAVTAICNANGDVTVDRSTFINNSSTFGGALRVGFFCNRKLRLENSTFYNNSANRGGAVEILSATNWSNSPRSITNNTFVNNSASSGEGAALFVGSIGDTVTVMNNIFYNDSGQNNCNFSQDNVGTPARMQSRGYNIDSGSSCRLGAQGQPGDLENTDPGLTPGPPVNNGGLTKTISPLPTSLTIDGGGNLNCPLVDQRKRNRPIEGLNGQRCDIGAFEGQWF